MANYLNGAFYGIRNQTEFNKGIQSAINQTSGQGIYVTDNLFCFDRNLSFLEDEKFMAAFSQHASTDNEKAICWRNAMVVWGARNGLRLEGDFVECGCYKGTTARIVYDTLDFASWPERHYFLYDLFDHDPSMPHHALPEHSKQLYAEVKARFADTPNVTVTQGKVPEILAEVAPEKIAFMHLDLNNAEAEVGALEVLFDRIVPGGGADSG